MIQLALQNNASINQSFRFATRISAIPVSSTNDIPYPESSMSIRPDSTSNGHTPAASPIQATTRNWMPKQPLAPPSTPSSSHTPFPAQSHYSSKARYHNKHK